MATRTARHSIDIYRWIATGLFTLACLIWLVLWPRDCTSCSNDGREGNEAAIWVGVALCVLAIYPLLVYIVAVGAQLGLRADREAEAARAAREARQARAATEA